MAHSNKNCLIFFVAIILIGVSAQDEKHHNKTTTEAPTTTPPTTTPPTTTSIPTKPTTEPTTTKTSTEPPTTTTKVPIPTTTEPPKTTSTEAPTPPERPTVNFYRFPAAPDQPCILVEFAMQLNITYMDTTNKSLHVIYNIPSNITTKVLNGECGNDTNKITLKWIENTLEMQFVQNKTSNDFKLSQMHFVIYPTGKEFPNARGNQTIDLFYKGKQFTTPLHMSYHCTKPQSLNLTSALDKNETVATLAVAHLQLEPFHNSKSADFSTAKDCDSIDTPDIVPIAVGCALAGLVFIVLIAYLVGRRRAQARGYLSM